MNCCRKKDELLQVASHELRTPFTTIRKGVSQVADGVIEPATPEQADRDKIAQAFVNLLANALKFTEAGEVLPTVEEMGKQVACAVRDTGSGISPDNLPKVFQKF